MNHTDIVAAQRYESYRYCSSTTVWIIQILKFILLFIIGCWLQVSTYYKDYVTGHFGADFLDYLLSTKTSKRVSRIKLAIVWLSVLKRGEKASTVTGVRLSGKQRGVRLCCTGFCLSRQYYYLSIMYLYILALLDQDQVLCTWQSVKSFSRFALQWGRKNFSLGPERALGGPNFV
jgi:hypothetical protein